MIIKSNFFSMKGAKSTHGSLSSSFYSPALLLLLVAVCLFLTLLQYSTAAPLPSTVYGTYQADIQLDPLTLVVGKDENGEGTVHFMCISACQSASTTTGTVTVSQDSVSMLVKQAGTTDPCIVPEVEFVFVNYTTAGLTEIKGAVNVIYQGLTFHLAGQRCATLDLLNNKLTMELVGTTCPTLSQAPGCKPVSPEDAAATSSIAVGTLRSVPTPSSSSPVPPPQPSSPSHSSPHTSPRASPSSPRPQKSNPQSRDSSNGSNLYSMSILSVLCIAIIGVVCASLVELL